jgi:signal transduction histidine kinase
MVRRLLVGCMILLTVVTTNCAGSARTPTAYRLKARSSAKAALSAVETATLAARLVHERRTFSTYVSVVLDSAERDATATESTFASIQSPSRASDRLRNQISRALNDASDAISKMRIAARREEWPELLDVAQSLPKLADQLQRYSELPA